MYRQSKSMKEELLQWAENLEGEASANRESARGWRERIAGYEAAAESAEKRAAEYRALAATLPDA